jgi:uncharacterized FlaG/YvyC family protein
MEKIAISQHAIGQNQAKVAKRAPDGSGQVHHVATPNAGSGIQKTLYGAASGSSTGSTGSAGTAPGNEAEAKIKDLQRLADEAFESEDLRLSISFDKEAGRFVYRGVDRETGEVVRQYPPEEIIDQIAAIREYAGVIVDRKL